MVILTQEVSLNVQFLINIELKNEIFIFQYNR